MEHKVTEESGHCFWSAMPVSNATTPDPITRIFFDVVAILVMNLPSGIVSYVLISTATLFSIDNQQQTTDVNLFSLDCSSIARAGFFLIRSVKNSSLLVRYKL